MNIRLYLFGYRILNKFKKSLQEQYLNVFKNTLRDKRQQKYIRVGYTSCITYSFLLHVILVQILYILVLCSSFFVKSVQEKELYIFGGKI